MPPASTVQYLGTSAKHLHLRRVAHGRYLKTIQKMKARYAKSHRIARFSKGDKVAVNIPRKDRSSTTLQRLPCIVVEVLGSQQNTYRLQCRHGVISKCYPRGQLEPYTGGLEIKWPSKMAPKLSLRETVKKEYPSLLLGDRCHCKTGSITHRCACRANGRPCLAHCHSGSNCANKEDKNGILVHLNLAIAHIQHCTWPNCSYPTRYNHKHPK